MVSSRHLSHDSEGLWAVLAQLDENRLTQEVSAEKHAVADLVGVEVTGEVGVAEWGRGFDAQHEAEPGASGPTLSVVPGKC